MLFQCSLNWTREGRSNRRGRAPALSRYAFYALCLVATGNAPAEIAADPWALQPAGQILPLNATRTVAFDTDEGSWLSLDLSPDGKRLVFDLLGDLYTLDADGGRARRISGGIAFDAQPMFSPDGRWIAFVSDRSGAENLWIVRPDGSDARQISFHDDDTPFVSPAWSADGKSLFVSRYRADLTAYELWRSDLGGRFEEIVAAKAPSGEVRSALGATPSQDGRYLYYAALRGEIDLDDVRAWTIRRRDLATGQEEEMVGEPARRAGLTPRAFFRPAISPNGRWLAYGTRLDGETALRLRNLETGEDHLLAYPVQHDQTQASSWQDLAPRHVFSRDSSALFITRGGKIERIDIATGAATPIPFTARVEAKLGPLVRTPIKQEEGPVRARLIQTPEQSPDGTRIVFSALGRIYVMALDGSTAPQPLTSEGSPQFHPSWSPDGQAVVYVSWTVGEAGHIWMASASGDSPPRQISRTAAFYTNPAYLPDGTAVLALSSPQQARLRTTVEPSSGHREASLMVFSLGGSEGRVITTGRMAGKPHFGPNPSVAHVYFAEGLESVDLLNGDHRPRLSVVGPSWYFTEGSAPVTRVQFSPDGRWALAQNAQQLHLVAVPKEPGSKIDLSRPSPAHRQLTDVGADFFDWADEGRTITWAVGSTFYRLPLREVGRAEPESFSVAVTVSRDTPRGTLLLRGGRAISMGPAGVIENADILIKNNRIAAVGPQGRFAVPTDATIRDISGKTVIPGLIDAHDHVGDIRRDVLDMEPWGLRARLAYGITSAFDPSTLSIDLLAYQDLIDAGLVVGPRVPSTGTAIFSFNRFRSLDEVRAVLRRYRDHYRIRNLKQYRVGNRRTRQWVAIAARELGMVPTTEGALAMKLELSQIADGFSGHEHALVVMPPAKDVIEFVARSKTSYTTTLLVVNGGPPAQDFFIVRDNPHDDHKYRCFTPHFVADQKTRRRDWRVLSDYSFRKVAEGAAAISRAGGLLGMGTHGDFPGIGFLWEMESHVMGGMTPEEVLRAATIGSAATIGRDAEFGSLEVGKYADLVILDADPREDIRNMRRVVEVMMNGRLRRADTLDELWPQQHSLPLSAWLVEDELRGRTRQNGSMSCAAM